MSRSTPRAVLIYQHLVNGRDQEMAERLGSMIRKARGEADSWRTVWHVCGKP
ncbi:integrase [Streptomyces sp. CG4]|uniref:integrase n=1 Tax=Streptomyces sp. CG4 TaxID=408783 RepID=UPI0034E2A9DE